MATLLDINDIFLEAAGRPQTLRHNQAARVEHDADISGLLPPTSSQHWSETAHIDDKNQLLDSVCRYNIYQTPHTTSSAAMGSYTPPAALPWRKTPLVESSILSRIAGCRIFLKLENIQPSTSFKSRGIGNLIRRAIESAPAGQPMHFFCSSGGNAGLAAVTAAVSLGYPCTVVMPTTTEASMVTKLKAAGAHDVISYGASWQFADAHMREVIMADARAQGIEAVYVPPFDDPRIWEGAESLAEEMQEQFPEADGQPDAVVCSVGGGGLFIGLMQGLEKVGWGKDTQVLAVETDGAQSLHYSLEKGELSTLPAITSLATSLGAIRVAPRAFELAHQHQDDGLVRSLVLSDAEACMGCWCFADDERILVEPACGVSVALAYEPERLRKAIPNFGPQSKVVIIVCGGARTSLDTLIGYREKFGPEIERMGLTGAK
ncbi:MAG: pyridoxal-phosphate dependent enzyme [Terriglobus roseus]|nr:pyridoxal-phosphate dependent enzyme [Terriglobus roseus]